MKRVGYFMAALATLIAGCSSTYRQKDIRAASESLRPGVPVVIATPQNGWYSTSEYARSGEMTARAIRAAFMGFTNAVTVLSECENLAAMKDKAPPGFSYYVVPEILHWEDRATEWSGLPDQIQVKIAVYEAGTWRELASTNIWGKSKWATFGGDHPQDLLRVPISRYVASLYASPAIPEHEVVPAKATTDE